MKSAEETRQTKRKEKKRKVERKKKKADELNHWAEKMAPA